MSYKHLSATQSFSYGNRLTQLMSREQLPERWKNTPIEEFIAAHNFETPIAAGVDPKLLIVSCIEYRFQPDVPPGFTYVIRSPGGRMSHLAESEFALSYIFAKGVRHIALVGHNDCGMTKVDAFKPNLVQALVDQGWEQSKANDFIENNANQFRMDDEIDALQTEFLSLSSQFNNVEIAPLFVSLASTRLHLPNWYFEHMSNSAKST